MKCHTCQLPIEEEDSVKMRVEVWKRVGHFALCSDCADIVVEELDALPSPRIASTTVGISTPLASGTPGSAIRFFAVPESVEKIHISEDYNKISVIHKNSAVFTAFGHPHEAHLHLKRLLSQVEEYDAKMATSAFLLTHVRLAAGD